MNDLHSRALALFDDYADLPRAALAQRLDVLAREDPPLHDALCALLAADRERPCETLLGRPPAELIREWQQTVGNESGGGHPDDDARLGTRLGPWRISEVIARGGMGTVYAAERDDGQYRQRVALKCMRLELDTPTLDAAFRRERDLLARLDHPGIAGLIDGGLDDQGRPWFAMRFVDGAPVDTWCDAHRLDISQRVDLLLQACDALAYAHAHGVVHGDIKPGNLLVGRDGRTQLVDFGISSVREASDGRLGVTPDYAAPEHLRLGTPSAATDIYAFGVLMYRLLCGQWPTPRHLLRTALPNAEAEGAAMETLLAGAPPETAALRGADSVAALSRRLSGDLSAIARKAVAPRPVDRYASVSALADDLRRWQAHRPVAAHPVGWSGRARRFLRRHPVPVGLAAALALLTGVALAVHHRDTEYRLREAQATENVSHLFATTLGTATLSGLGAAPFSSQALLGKTERELRKLPLAAHPSVLARSLATLARSYAAIGDIRAAQRLADEATRILGGHSDPAGEVAAIRISLLNLQGRHDQAEDQARAAIERLQGESGAAARRARIVLTAELARAQWGRFQPQRAARTLDDALAEARATKDRELIAELLIERVRFGVQLLRTRQAEADTREAIALASPANPVLADDAREQLTRLLLLRQSTDALSAARQLLASRRRTLGENHPKTGRAWIQAGATDTNAHARRDAALRKGLAVIEASYGRDHPEYAAAIGAAIPNFGVAPDEKIAMLRHAVAVLDRTIGPYSERALSLRTTLGRLLIDLPGTDRRYEHAQRGMAVLEGVIRDKRRSGVPAPWERLKLAYALIVYAPEARMAQADALIRISRRDATVYFEEGDSYRMQVGIFGDKLLYRTGERAQADRNFAYRIESNRAFIANPDLEHGINDRIRAVTLHESLLYRGFHAYETCDRARAEAFFREALRFDLLAFGADSNMLREPRTLLASLAGHGPLRVGDDQALIVPSELAALNARAAACKT